MAAALLSPGIAVLILQRFKYLESNVVINAFFRVLAYGSIIGAFIIVILETKSLFDFFDVAVLIPFLDAVKIRTLIPIAIMLGLYLFRGKYHPLTVLLLIPVYYGLHEFTFNFVLFVIYHHDVPFLYPLFTQSISMSQAMLYFANFLQPAILIFLLSLGRPMLRLNKWSLTFLGILVAYFAFWLSVGFPLSIHALAVPMTPTDPRIYYLGNVMEFFWSCFFIAFFYTAIKPTLFKGIRP